MKIPNSYSPKHDFKTTQQVFFKFLNNFKKNLANQIPSLEVNIPIFSKKEEFEKQTNRKIFFDSINDYETYYMNDTFLNYFKKSEILEKIIDLNSNSEYMIFNNNNVVVRDKKAKEIFEIQKNIISGIFLQREEGAKSSTFIKIIYQVLFDTLNELKKKKLVEIDIPKKMNFFYKERELKNFRFFSEELILNDILSKEGIIVWSDSNIYDLIGITKINDEALLFAKVEPLTISTKSSGINFKTFHYFEINISNIVSFLLEKYSITELF